MDLDGQSLFKKSQQIVGGEIAVPRDGIGLGIEIDRVKLNATHNLYEEKVWVGRNGAKQMQYLISSWQFDPKKPALVR